MIIIQNDSSDPYFNIASEEYLLKNFTEDVLMLYVNAPSVILGKHQNALAEINFRYIYENNIPVIRRLSGGGTVFHDQGNLNFTFIRNAKQGDLVNFKRFTRPVMNVLNELGVDVKFEGKNDLRVDGLKISGNAEHVFKQRVLHHGTLLFQSDLEQLGEAIRVKPERYFDKAVQSVRSKVTNIATYIQSDLTIKEFGHKIENYIRKNETSEMYSFSETDILSIHDLVQNKYATWDWIYGYSPKYRFKTRLSHSGHTISLELSCEKSIIKQASSQPPNESYFNDFIDRIHGKKHAYETIHELIHKSFEGNEKILRDMAFTLF